MSVFSNSFRAWWIPEVRHQAPPMGQEIDAWEWIAMGLYKAKLPSLLADPSLWPRGPLQQPQPSEKHMRARESFRRILTAKTHAGSRTPVQPSPKTSPSTRKRKHFHVKLLCSRKHGTNHHSHLLDGSKHMQVPFSRSTWERG